MSETAPTIFHLIGSPGVGKYTVAKEVAAMTGARLVDNHSIANLIFNVLATDGVTPLPDGTWPHVGAVRKAVLEAMRTIAPRHLSYVFTNYLVGEDEGETAAFEEMVALAAHRGSIFVPVLFRCETSELMNRIGTESRKQRMKLIDPVLGAKFNDETPHFETDHPNVLRLDVTSLAPEESARRIVEWAKSRSL